MNERHLQSISHVSVDVNLMVENVTQNKNGIMVSVSASVRKVEDIVCLKKIKPGILAHVLACLTCVNT